MGTNWVLIIPVIIAIIAVITFFVIQNQKDKKELMKELIKEDEISNQKVTDTEVNTTE